MEEKKNKKQTIIIVIAVIAVIALLIGATTAYFLARQQSSEKTITTGTVGIKYTDNEDTVAIDNIIPIYDTEIKTKANKFSFNIENLGNATTYVDMSLTDITIDESLKDLEFKWALYSGDEKISNGNFRNITNNEILLTKNIELANNSNKDYELYIWISENDLDQSDMMGATFTGKITVEGSQEKGADLLSTVIKNNNSPIVEEEPDFSTVATTDEGLIKGIDDDGDTYYFRGAVEDNYVKIEGLKWNYSTKRYTIGTNDGPSGDLSSVYNYDEAKNECHNLYNSRYDYESVEECINDIQLSDEGHTTEEEILWRIIRVNGDGTIRLIANEQIDDKNGVDNGSEEMKYTYNNSAPNVQDGTNSIIKTYLENWYTENLSEYDRLIANTRYCNDTSNRKIPVSYHVDLYYGAYDRLHNDNPTPQYICPNTTENYGGEYDLKIGLLSADEAVFAGGSFNESNEKYYLNIYTIIDSGDRSYYLNSPLYNSDTTYPSGIHTSLGSAILTSFELRNVSKYTVIPVINLRADILYTNGDGTKTSPYIVNLDSI